MYGLKKQCVTRLVRPYPNPLHAVLKMSNVPLNSALSVEWMTNLPRGLTLISMENAKLKGSLPAAVNLPKLETIFLSMNQLTG